MTFLDALRRNAATADCPAVQAEDRRRQAAVWATEARTATTTDLDRLAELTDHMSPLEAAQQLFGAPQ